MSTAQIFNFIAIAIYLMGMLYIGFRASKRNKNTDDFYLGGRKLGPFVTAMSAEASDMSGWLLMGLPGVALVSGVADAGWTAIGLALGTYVNWLIVSKRIRSYTQLTGSITLPDFFSKRFHDQRNMLCGIAALVILVFFIPYTASGFSACGKLFAAMLSGVFGEGSYNTIYMTAMIAGAVVIVLYCTMGGFLAASITDFLQSIIMTFALVMILFFGISVAGGFDAVMGNARSMEGYLSLTNIYDAATGTGRPYGLLSTCSTMAWGLGYFGMPHILLRFMAIEDPKKLTTSRRVASIWVVISMGVAVLIGIIGNAASKAPNAFSMADKDPETIIVELSNFLSQNGALAALLGGLVLAGILASTMSTADSQLLAASSSFSQNLMQDFFGVKMDQKKTLLAARLTVVVIAIIGAILAADPNSSVFGIVSFAWAGFGAAFGPVVLFSLFWKRTTKWGALAGMISGGAMVFIWKYGISQLGGAWAIYELLPAFLTACVFILVVSLLTRAPDQKVLKEFEKAKIIH